MNWRALARVLRPLAKALSRIMSIHALATPLVDAYPNVWTRRVYHWGISSISNVSVHKMLRNFLSDGVTDILLKNLLISVLRA